MSNFTSRSTLAVLALLVCASSSAAQAQTITALSAPTLAQAGRLKISGSGFGTTQGSSVVMIGGAEAPVSRWSSNSITAYVSDSAPLGVDQVQVMTGGGESNAVPLIVIARQAAAGRVAWRFQADDLYIRSRPGVAPDGTVYALDVGGHLYALTPSGGVKWIFNTTPVAIQTVEVGPDSTVYFTSGNTIFALNPDGTLKWKVSDPSGSRAAAGPTVGPDGNIYAVTDDSGLPNGLGAMTLSPDGQILSNRPGYTTGRGDENTREIVFGGDQFYFSMNHLDLNFGLQFFQLGGNFLFAREAGGSQPVVGAHGNIYESLANNELGVFDPSGNLLRSSTLGTLTDPDAGSDGTIYVGANLDVVALNPDLSTKWRHAISRGAYFGGGPIVNASNTLVVAAVSDIGAPGFVRGIDAATGKRTWQVELPAENGGYVRATSRARFSGVNRMYFGTDVNDSVPEPYCYLYAINTGPRVTLASLTLNPVVVRAGAASQGTVTLTHRAPSDGTVVTLASSKSDVAPVPPQLTVPAGASSATFTVQTAQVSGDTRVTILASYAGVRKTATLLVTP